MKIMENQGGDAFTKFVIVPPFSVFVWLPVYLFILIRSLPIFPEMTPEFRKKVQDILP